MNQLVLSFLLALCAVHTQAHESYYKFRANVIRNVKCMDTENVPMPVLHAYAVDGELIEGENHPQLQCFEACLLEQAGVMNNCVVSNEDLANFEVLTDFHDALTACRGTVDVGERCACAYQLSRCMDEKLPRTEDDL